MSFDFNTFGTSTQKTTSGSFDFDTFGTDAGPIESTIQPTGGGFLRGETTFPVDRNSSPVTNFTKSIGNIPSSYMKMAGGVADIPEIYSTGKELLAQNEGSVWNTNVAVAKSALQDLKGLAESGFDMWKQMGESIYKTLENNVELEGSVLKGAYEGTKQVGAESLGKVAEMALNDPLLIPSLLYAPKKTLGRGDTISELARPVSTRIEAGLEKRALESDANKLKRVELQNKDLRTGMDMSPDANAGARDRITRSNVLQGAINEDGVITTTGKGGPIERYRAMTIDGNEGIVRDMLKVEGASIKLPDIRKALEAEFRQTYGLEGKTLATALKNIPKEIAGLAERLEGKTVPLWRLQNAKIASKNGVNFQRPSTGIYAKAVARAYKKLIEKTSKLNVAEVNGVLSKFEGDIDLLESLNGKRVPGGKLGVLTSQVIGSMAGVGAGALIGGIPGAVVGGIVGQNLSKGLKQRTLKKYFDGKERPMEKSPVLEGARQYVEGQSKKPAKQKANIKAETSKGVIGKTIPQKKGIVTKVVDSLKKSIKNPSVGLAIKDVTKGQEADNAIRVGLSPVKGSVAGKYDDLVTKADELFAEGKFDEATKVYSQIVQGAQKNVQDRFKRTNIKVKFNSVGFGVYEGVPEPNIDFTAIVKPEDIDLFHNILSDLSQKDFNQHSFVTYKQSRLNRDVPYGIIDRQKGVSSEPHFIFKPENPLTLADVKMVNEALADADLQAMSIKEGGSRIDVLNLTGYNKDYDVFINKINDFKKNLDSKGVAGESEFARAEVRFVGNKGSSANTTYERGRRAFYKENPSFIKPDTIESKVLDAIRYKPTISRKELESIVNSGEVSPTEKAVFRDVLSEMKDGPMKAIEVQSRLRGKLLTIEGKSADGYVNYGWDNALPEYDSGKAVVFDSNFKHGRGQNHYKSEGLFGHARYALSGDVNPTTGKQEMIATIGELQSDFFQHDKNIDLFKDPDTFYQYQMDQIEKKRTALLEAKRMSRENPGMKAWIDNVVREEGIIAQELRKIQPLEIERNLAFARKNLAEYQFKLDSWKNDPHVTKQAKEREVSKYEGMIEVSKNTVATLEAEAKANPVRPDVLKEQMLNFARSNQYRQRLLEETIDYIMKTDKPDEIRIAKPSMVAKIEGYLSSGDDMAPYELPNGGQFGGNAEDLTFGDEVGYGGEPYIVVGVQAQGRGWGGPAPTMIGIAPEDKVNKFRLSDHIDGEVEYRMEEGTYTLSDVADDATLTKEQLEEIGDNVWPVDSIARQYLEKGEFPTKAEFIKKAEADARIAIEESVWDDLRDIYGRDSVFADESDYDPMVYTVQDNAEPEWFNQPSSYTPQEGALYLDEGRAVGKEVLPDYMGVLENYYKLHEDIIPKYEQKIGQKFIDGVIDDNQGDPSGYASFKPDYSRQMPSKRTF